MAARSGPIPLDNDEGLRVTSFPASCGSQRRRNWAESVLDAQRAGGAVGDCLLDHGAVTLGGCAVEDSQGAVVADLEELRGDRLAHTDRGASGFVVHNFHHFLLSAGRGESDRQMVDAVEESVDRVGRLTTYVDVGQAVEQFVEQGGELLAGELAT